MVRIRFFGLLGGFLQFSEQECVGIVDLIIVLGKGHATGHDVADQLVGILLTHGVLQHGEKLVVLDTVTDIAEADGGDGIQLVVSGAGIYQNAIAGACLGEGATQGMGAGARCVIVGDVPVQETGGHSKLVFTSFFKDSLTLLGNSALTLSLSTV